MASSTNASSSGGGGNKLLTHPLLPSHPPMPLTATAANPTPHSIADQFAANGYFVVMPDLFYGDPAPLNRPPGFDLMSWLQNHLTEHVDPIIKTVLKEMRGPLGCKRIGGVGYCFGGKYVCRFLKEGRLDAGYTAHPSFVEREELEGIMGPLSISAAGMFDLCAFLLGFFLVGVRLWLSRLSGMRWDGMRWGRTEMEIRLVEADCPGYRNRSDFPRGQTP